MKLSILLGSLQAQGKINAASGELTDPATREIISTRLRNFAAFVRKVQTGTALQA